MSFLLWKDMTLSGQESGFLCHVPYTVILLDLEQMRERSTF